MAEAIRTCKRCGRQYTGWHCPSKGCRAAREKRNASARKSRARNGGKRMRHLRSAGGFSWGSTSVIGPIHADACPKPEEDVYPAGMWGELCLPE